mmetsp:Transcript_9780/g.25286  ORF Transcript_9780/g.25286 Transcript_9780/m.25286 type:complete len:218 (+) Transcript_9780:399-1052(+)
MMLAGKGSAKLLSSWKQMPPAAMIIPIVSSLSEVASSSSFFQPRSLANSRKARAAIVPPRRPEVTALITICRYHASTSATMCTNVSIITGTQCSVSAGITWLSGGPSSLRKKKRDEEAMPTANAVVRANLNWSVASTARYAAHTLPNAPCSASGSSIVLNASATLRLTSSFEPIWSTSATPSPSASTRSSSAMAKRMRRASSYTMSDDQYARCHPAA